MCLSDFEEQVDEMRMDFDCEGEDGWEIQGEVLFIAVANMKDHLTVVVSKEGSGVGEKWREGRERNRFKLAALCERVHISSE